MLGIWADEEDDIYIQSSTVAPTSSFRPMNFVSKGFYDVTKPENGASNDEEDEHKDSNAHRFKESHSRSTGKLGAWEKNTKGFGSRILSKMGWKGKGLGKNEQGMVNPIETKVRAERGGLREEDVAPARTVEKKRSKTMNVDEMDEATFRTLTNRQQKSKLYRRHVSEDLEEDAQVILDMRGPEKRVYTSMDQINTNYEEVDINELKIIQLEQRKKFIEQSRSRLMKDEEKKRSELESNNVHINHLSTLQSLIEQCNSLGFSKNEDNLLEVIRVLEVIRTDFAEEYENFSLESLVFHYIYPIIESKIRDWDPLLNPEQIIGHLTLLKNVLGNQDDEEEVEDPFEIRKGKTIRKLDSFNRIIYELILPKIQSAVAQWDVHDPDSCIDMVETWVSVMSQTAIDHVIYGLVLEKLKAEVEKWNPQKESFPIHTWIHPWLPILGDGIKELFDPIRRKFDSVFSNWVLSDKNVFMSLAPWHSIFEKKIWNRMMARTIIPKLHSSFKRFVVDPSNQDMTIWNDVMLWADKIPTDAFCHILESEFFPKWFRILGMWMLSDDANYEEIAEWYLLWKNQFPTFLLHTQRIKIQFRYSLVLMNNVLSGMDVSTSSFAPFNQQSN